MTCFHKKSIIKQANLWIDAFYHPILVISPVCDIIKQEILKDTEYGAHSENILTTFQSEKLIISEWKRDIHGLRHTHSQSWLDALRFWPCVCLQKAHRQLGPSCSMTKIASKFNMFNTWGCVSVCVCLGQRHNAASMTRRVHFNTEEMVLSNFLRWPLKTNKKTDWH